MAIIALLPIAGFIAPQQITTSPTLILWVFPLAAAIAVVYKVTKLPRIKTVNFIKETSVLFGSIVIFISIAAIILYLVDLLIIQ